jgi:hypothetical protein
MKINFDLTMLTHTHDECKYRFRAFDGEFSGNSKQSICYIKDNLVQINKLFISSNTVSLRKVFNLR